MGTENMDADVLLFIMRMMPQMVVQGNFSPTFDAVSVLKLLLEGFAKAGSIIGSFLTGGGVRLEGSA